MRRVEGDRVVERAAPVLEGLAGAAVDEVEVERGEAGGAGQLDGSLDVGAVVGAAERLQHVGRGGLHAEGETVHAAGEVGVEQLGGDVVGVALHRHLGAGGARDAVEHRDQVGRRHEGRGAAADEHRRGGGQARGDEPVGVGAARREVAVDEVVAVGPGGEAAVVAARRAERHVQVHAEGVGRAHPPMVPRSAADQVRGGGGAGHAVVEDAEALEAIDRQVGRDVEDAGDGPQVVAPHGEHPAVEVAALHLDHPEVAGQHLGVGALGLLHGGEVELHRRPRRGSPDGAR